MKSALLLPVLAIMLFSEATIAKGLSIKPGLWEMTVTVEMNSMPQPHSDTSSECITATELSPEDFNQDESMPCDINDVDINGNTASWKISCPNAAGPPMAGRWELTSHGSSITGNGSLSMNMGGQQMVMNMTWNGQRVGDCN